MKNRIIKLTICLMVVVFMALTATSCSKPDSSDSILKTVYVRTDSDRGSMQAHFFSSSTQKSKDVEMELDKKEDRYSIYKASESVDDFDLVSFTRDNSDETIQLSFSPFVSGWYISSYGVMPFSYDDEIDEDNYGNSDFETVSLRYNDSRDKKIFIWVPDDYNKDDKQTKYSVIYMTDGQNLFKRTDTAYGCWNVAESVKAMNSIDPDTRAIIVGIDDGDGHRDNELTPDIGETAVGDPAYEGGSGEEFCEFVYGTVIPYIEENYNVYTDRKHTSICGSSSGGIESFYIGMEHPDKFATIGAMSPAFLLFSGDTWKEYLSKKTFDEYPVIYFYCGGSAGDTLEQAILDDCKKMPGYLETVSYPKDKMHEQYIMKAAHNESYWRAVFPQFLYYAFSDAATPNEIE